MHLTIIAFDLNCCSLVACTFYLPILQVFSTEDVGDVHSGMKNHSHTNKSKNVTLILSKIAQIRQYRVQ